MPSEYTDFGSCELLASAEGMLRVGRRMLRSLLCSIVDQVRGSVWMKRIACVCAAGLVLVVLTASAPAQAWCIWGFGQCPPSNPLLGEYALDGNPIAKLTITAEKITSSIGPVSFTADYVVKSVDGKNVTIEVGLPDPKVTLDVQVERDQIRIGTKHLFAGVWKKTGAKP